MKKFVIRICNVAIIVAALLGYNHIVAAREAADAEAKAEADAENARIAAEYAELAEEAEQADSEETGAYTDGTYEGTATGFGGDITVEVVVEGGEITAVNILSAAQEDGAYLAMAEDIIPTIIEAQSAEVDTITGATFSSTGIKNAVTEALEEAK